MQGCCCTLAFESAEGPANMALDEALLDDAAAGSGAASLRLYGWSIPTLSIGYFQPIAAVRAQPRWHTIPVVRRQTGGGAIYHHHDLTYALVVPACHPLARPSTQLYRAVHEVIARALVHLGVPAARRGEEAAAKYSEQKRSLLCFTSTDADDIVTGSVKIVGSAQRRRHGAVLQHGSILWARTAVVPELPGVCDVADVSVDLCDWSERLSAEIPEAIGLIRRPASVSESVRAQARQLRHDRYLNPAWTDMR